MVGTHRRMVAFEIGEPRCVVVLGGEIGAIRLRWPHYRDRWCGGIKGVIRARRMDLLQSVHSLKFDPMERRWRVARDEIGRPVLIIGPAVALVHALRDWQADRWLDDQMRDLFGDRGWIAREAADAAAALCVRMGGALKRAH